MFHGAASAGGAVTTLNPLYTTGEIACQLRSSGARWLVTVPALLDKAKAAGDGLEIIVVGDPQAAGTVSARMTSHSRSCRSSTSTA